MSPKLLTELLRSVGLEKVTDQDVEQKSTDLLARTELEKNILNNRLLRDTEEGKATDTYEGIARRSNVTRQRVFEVERRILSRARSIFNEKQK